MKVLSFDIGMKHLAMCKLEYIEGRFSILFWKCINIIHDENKKEILVCGHKLKNGKICNKTSSMKRININNEEINEIYLCKIHYKMHKKIYNEDEYKEIKKPKKVKISKLNIYYLSKQLSKCLDELDDDIFNVDYILLENQPRFNIRMKCFASMLFQYCTMKTLYNENLKQILYVHAKDALKLYDGPKIENKSNNKYKNKKDNSIIVTKYLLKDQNEWLLFLDSQKTKLDDLCDAFLNGAYYLYQQNSR